MNEPRQGKGTYRRIIPRGSRRDEGDPSRNKGRSRVSEREGQRRINPRSGTLSRWETRESGGREEEETRGKAIAFVRTPAREQALLQANDGDSLLSLEQRECFVINQNRPITLRGKIVGSHLILPKWESQEVGLMVFKYLIDVQM